MTQHVICRSLSVACALLGKGGGGGGGGGGEGGNCCQGGGISCGGGGRPPPPPPPQAYAGSGAASVVSGSRLSVPPSTGHDNSSLPELGAKVHAKGAKLRIIDAYVRYGMNVEG